MSATQTALAAMARDIADAAGSTRWSDATVLQWLGLVHWQEFKNILNANNQYTLASFTVTEDADGRFLKTALDSGSADTLLTHYRILSLSQNTAGAIASAGPILYYKQVAYIDYPTPQASVLAPYVWYDFGSYIQVVPVQPTNTLQVVVNQLPQRADLLATGASTVVFPSGYETLLGYMTAAHMLQKGGAETPASLALQQQADYIRQPMMQDLRRTGIQPTLFRALDDAGQWGGV